VVCNHPIGWGVGFFREAYKASPTRLQHGFGEFELQSVRLNQPSFTYKGLRERVEANTSNHGTVTNRPLQMLFWRTFYKAMDTDLHRYDRGEHSHSDESRNPESMPCKQGVNMDFQPIFIGITGLSPSVFPLL
jgi:hypothetical protein